MENNFKNFLLGALIAAVPMFFYGYFRLKPISTQVQSNQRESLSSNQFLASLETKMPSPTNTPMPKPTSSPTITVQAQTASYAQYSKNVPDDIKILVERYATEHGVNKDMMTHIALCESNFRSNAVNGPYAGVYQFVSSTWVSNRRAMGLDTDPALRFNAEESVKTAAFKMGRDGFGAWPVCQQKARRALSYQN